MSLHKAEEVIDKLGLTEELLADRVASLGLSVDRRGLLAQAWDSINLTADAFVEELYAVFMAVPHLRSILANDARVTKLKQTQKRYLEDVFCAGIDRDYVKRRISLGLVHHQIRITPQWYLATYAIFLTHHVEALIAGTADPTVAREQILTFFQTILLDACFVLDAYGLQEDSQQLQQRSLLTQPSVDPGQYANASASAETTDWADDQPSYIKRIRLTTEEATNRAEFVGLTDRDRMMLRSLQPVFLSCMDDVLHGFYQFLSESPAHSRLVPPHQIARLIKQVRSYWIEFLSGSFDRPYAASRMRIGVIHEHIGVTPQIYLIGLGRQVTALVRHIPLDRPDYADVLKALFKALMFDVTFVIDAYMESRADTLLRTEGYANQLMASLHAAVAVIDHDFRVVFANKEFVSLVGIEPSLLYRMKLAEALPLLASPELFDELRLQKAGKLVSLQNWGQRTFRVTAMHLEEQQDSRPQSRAVLLEDVSELVRVMDDVEQDSAQFARLANVVSAVLWEMDFSSRTIFAISRQAVELTGHRDLSILGKPDAWFNLIIEDDRARFLHCCQLLRDGQRATCDYRMLRGDGEIIWLRSHLTGVLTAGAMRIAAVTVDITQSRQAEKLRLASIAQVSAGIAHVINNTLTIVMNNIELHGIKDEASADPSRLQDALAACHRAAHVVRQLQAFAGGQLLRPSVHSLAHILRSAIPALQELVGSGVRIETQIVEPLWLCRIDAQQLIVAVQHLCSNARDAMADNGTIQIAAANVERASLAFDDPGFNRDWVELRVSDSGEGMTADIRRRAAEPFFTTRHPAEHSGLGLSLVYGFVTQSGGYMILQTEPGGGTDVILRFPKHETVQPAHQSKTSTARQRVLIVDDDEAVAHSISMLVGNLGYEVHTCFSASDALAYLESESVDFLLADVFLGTGPDGIVMSRQIVALYPHIQVIIMSGYAKEACDGNEWMSTWRFLPKPFSTKNLAEALQSVARTS